MRRNTRDARATLKRLGEARWRCLRRASRAWERHACAATALFEAQRVAHRNFPARRWKSEIEESGKDALPRCAIRKGRGLFSRVAHEPIRANAETDHDSALQLWLALEPLSIAVPKSPSGQAHGPLDRLPRQLAINGRLVRAQRSTSFQRCYRSELRRRVGAWRRAGAREKCFDASVQSLASAFVGWRDGARRRVLHHPPSGRGGRHCRAGHALGPAAE